MHHRTSLRRRLPLLATLAPAILMLVAAATANGAPGAVDPSFGGGGGAALPPDRARLSLGTAASVQTDGSVMVAGAGTSFSLRDDDDFDLDIRVHPTVWRYQADGSLDSSFGAGGAAKLYLQNHLSVATDVVALPDGRTLVSGTSVGLLSASTFVARLDAAGQPDPAFGRGGFVTTLPEHLNALVPVSMHALADGRIVVVATSFSGDVSSLDPEEGRRRRADLDVVLLRYLADGTLDPSFGSGGIVQYDTRGTSSLDVALTAAARPDGTITVGGTAIADRLERARALVVRFRADGTLDPAFGSSGVAPQPSRAETFDVVTAIEARADGGTSFGVARFADGGMRTTVRRVEAGGQPRAWSRGGMDARVPHAILPMVLLTLPDGRTLVGGTGTRWGGGHEDMDDGAVAGIARLRASGAADRSFDRTGASFAGRDELERPSWISGLEVRPDGTVVAAGTFSGHAGLVRFFGDRADGARTRASSPRLRLGRPLVRRCGATRAAACRIDGRRRGTVRFDVTTSRAVPAGHLVHVRIDHDEWGWYDSRTVRVRVDGRGRATVRVPYVKRQGGLYRVRAFVPASATTASAMTAPVFVRVVRRGGRPGPGVVVPTPAAVDACTRAGASSGALALNARAACEGVGAARRSGIDGRTAARRLLGR